MRKPISTLLIARNNKHSRCSEALNRKEKWVYKQWIGYRELKPLEKLVLDWNWQRLDAEGKSDDGPHESLVTVEFRDLWGSTEVVLTHELLPTRELREGVRRGWNGCFDVLERHLQV